MNEKYNKNKKINLKKTKKKVLIMTKNFKIINILFQ